MDKQSKLSLVLVALTVIILAALGYLPVMAYQDETPTDIPLKYRGIYYTNWNEQ